MKKRILSVLAIWSVITICVFAAFAWDIDVPVINIIGAYASSLVIAVIAYRFPYSFFLSLLVFDIFAAAFGSVLNFYRTIDSYDRIVHFMSGIIAADGGRIVFSYLRKKYTETDMPSLTVLFSMIFAFACAGLWEVYEFIADTFIGTVMQGNNLNTMGDIVSGVLGGIVYAAALALIYRRRRDKI